MTNSPKRWLMVVVSFVLPHCLAQLRAKTMRPAPALVLLSMGPPRQFRSYRSQARPNWADEIFAAPHRKHSLGLGAAATRFKVPSQTGRKRETLNELQSAHNHRIRWQERRNQTTAERNTRHQVLGRYDPFLEGRKGEWKDKTQWHNVVLFGQGFAQLAPRLVKGAHVFVQGELMTREYDRTIMVPNGKESIEHVIQQLAVELKAETVRMLDRTANAESGSPAQPAVDEDVSL
jgi:single-stranded DNA-binding protein